METNLEEYTLGCPKGLSERGTMAWKGGRKDWIGGPKKKEKKKYVGLICFIRETRINIPVFLVSLLLQGLCEDFTNDAKAFLKIFKTLPKCDGRIYYNVQLILMILMWYSAMLSHFSHVWLFATLWAVAHQAPLSLGFSRQEYWSGLLCPLIGHLSDPGIECTSQVVPEL